MGRRRIATGTLAAAVVILCTGCSTDGAPSPSPEPSTTATTTPPTTTPSTTTSTTTTSSAPSPAPTPATTTDPAPDALAFFRAQEGPCREFARQMGNPVGVEPERFRDATVVRELGNGATQIRDGHGTRLVVVPRRGIVLPASGRTDDVMPPPYEFGCSEKVFVGASHD